MESDSAMGGMAKTPVLEAKIAEDCVSEVANSTIYVDPEKEEAARRKFDKFLVPVSLVFIVLSALDRNNVSEVLIPQT